MTTIALPKVKPLISGKIKVTGSKSETNRLLILKALFGEDLRVENISNSDDSVLMQKALTSSEEIVDISHAGTAMRFLTAYFSSKEGRDVILTGSARMKERPIGILVDALRQLDADITYVENEGYPPIAIKGKRIEKSKVSMKANVSSQYISALMLIGSKLPNGIEINLVGELTSIPYLKMTSSLLEDLGVEIDWKDNLIKIKPLQTFEPKTFVVESDWSSASYFYSYVALSEKGKVEISSYKNNSLQGDSSLVEIYKKLGVETTFKENSICIEKLSEPKESHLELDLVGSPDIAQTIAVSCFGLGMSCFLTGLHTLKIKETDRLVALKTELEKLGAKVSITDKTLFLEKSTSIKDSQSIATYHDHRMAMAFAPLALKTNINIEDKDVVSKSYPDYWNDFFEITTR